MFSLIFKLLAFLFRGLDLIFPAYGTVFIAALIRPYYDIFQWLPEDFVPLPSLAATDFAIHYDAAVIFAALLIVRMFKKSFKFIRKYKIVERSQMRPQRIVVQKEDIE